LATVRRATTMPCWPRISEIWLSDSGFFAFSELTSCLISARIAVLEAAPPVSVVTWLPKNIEFENAARRKHEFLGRHARYRGFVQLERISDLAQHERPHCNFSVLEEWRCRSTIACDTRRMYRRAAAHFLISQRASCTLAGELPMPGIAVALQDVRIQAIDAQARIRPD
jgi:hypothetical protein